MENGEAKWIYHLKNGDEWAYRQLFDQHYTTLCKVAFEFLRDQYMAESTVNDVIVYFWENRQSIEIKSSLRAYLIAAVRFSCMNRLKRKSVKTEISFSQLAPANAPGGLREEIWSIGSDEYPLGILLEKELEGKINEAIRLLPEESREVFRLSRFDNKSYEEIAGMRNISVNTVKYHIKSALSKLKTHLKEYLDCVAIGMGLQHFL
ncbi:MAG: RNA polymerase sigma-70 factor [Bacteroidales bacterium]|jgi:RNA polymerase sigma-70 factor (ECF subfamily)|nr:RNA polymerase sigma-70 factor [Bacteroidales bacterium]